MLQVAKFYAHHLLRSAMQCSHQVVVSTAVHHLQPHIRRVRNIRNKSRRKRYSGNPVSFGPESLSQSKPRIIVHDTPVDVRCNHQTIALSDTNGRHYIAGKIIAG